MDDLRVFVGEDLLGEPRREFKQDLIGLDAFAQLQLERVDDGPALVHDHGLEQAFLAAESFVQRGAGTF
jgi:hypothetical protein